MFDDEQTNVNEQLDKQKIKPKKEENSGCEKRASGVG